ncbi:MAG: hypothetical protein AVDCRST_MAG38-579 [uncultured Solirubrobacteraceae bacterium]|uniref:DUF2934 domain-containing protein n=1 Tax=uncultured Solirubrobacteraceae bacterium TaxID=1162706 RepID=A0A6J4RFM3_9ACTN|nr:MAG: hypothetical protein AVDCRST_MAG38-579 [uncultured Solirubrobacteraceae bacterium]
MATRRRWTEETIRDSIAPIVAELGRMPTRRELADRDLGAAWSAMQRRGGIAAWRESLTAAAPAAATVTVVPVLAAAAEPVAASPVAAGSASSAATPPALLPASAWRPSRDDIAQRAYFIAQQRGGDPVANWLAAETELLAA